MSAGRRLRFARVRWPVSVAMRVVAAARAAQAMLGAPSVQQRRSVWTAPRTARRVPWRCTAARRAAMPPRGCEGLH